MQSIASKINSDSSISKNDNDDDGGEHFSEEYFYPIKKIKTIRYDDPDLDNFIKNNEPVLIKDSGLVASAIQNWNINYLKENLTKGKFNVIRSKTNRFLYWDDKKQTNVNNFEQPTEQMDISFEEFINLIETWSPNDNEYFYLQQKLNSTVGPKIVEDFLMFNWSWINERQKVNKWDELTSNLLLISQPDNLTPCHYDEQENFFAQIRGLKKCTLFSPEMFECLYTYPIYHPCDRQSKVDLYQNPPDLNKFPNLKNLKGYECIVAPGDVLYIPSYWFHQIKSIKPSKKTNPLDDLIISANFWYKCQPISTQQIVYPLKADQKVAMIRNIEKMVTQVLKNTNEVPSFFRALTLGRYTNE